MLINETDIPFITSDQPVINLMANYDDNALPSTGSILYYPISPNIAITVNDENKDQIQYLSEEEIIYYNEAISKASLHDIYANSKGVIENIKQSFVI